MGEVREIRGLYKMPGLTPWEVKIPDTLAQYQHAVEGYFQAVWLHDGIVALVNEEGIIRNLEPNINTGIHIFFGNVLFVADKGDEKFHSLTDEQLEEINRCFNEEWLCYPEGGE